MIRPAPGNVTPAHAHEGLELGLVLRGRLETDKACYGPGTSSGAPRSCDHGHQGVSDEDGYLLLATGRCETSFACGSVGSCHVIC